MVSKRHSKKRSAADEAIAERRLAESDYQPRQWLSIGHTGPWSRLQGPEVRGILVTRLKNRLCAPATSYSTNLLKITLSGRLVKSKPIDENLQNLQIHLVSFLSDGKDPIIIINFLKEYANTADTLQLCENEAYVALGKFIVVDAVIHNRKAIESSNGSGRTVASLPHAVAYLLRKCATNGAVIKSLEDLRALKQKPFEKEDEFFTRFVSVHSQASSS